jgi:glycosyltransferase involved in cell wall biosynthesis
MNLVKISVITAVYNNQATIASALESIFNQSYPSIELIVIDGGSTDGTLDVLNLWKDRIDVLVSESDEGIYDALNKGIVHSSGDVVGFLHSDDIFENNDVLANIASAFKDGTVDAVYGDLIYVRQNNIGQVIRRWKSGTYNNNSFSQGWMPPHPTFYVRRSVYYRLGRFDTRYHIAADYDIILRFLAVDKIKTVYIPKVLVRMRVGGVSNRSLKTILQKSYEDFYVLKRNNVGGIVALLRKNFRKLAQFWQ